MVIVSPHFARGGTQDPRTADDAQRIKNFNLVMATGSYAEKNDAILDLSWPQSERAAKSLLRRLKQNLSAHKGNQEQPWTESRDGMTTWGTDPPENQLLITAIAKQGYVVAVPTLLKMFKMNPDRRGISSSNLAYFINEITGKPVVYEENGEKKTFPTPPKVSVKKPSTRKSSIEQIVGREPRGRVSQPACCGEGGFDSPRRVNSAVMRSHRKL